MKLSAFMLLFASAALAATEEQINRTFPAAAGGSLVVDVDVGSIAVATNAGPGEVAVEVWRKVTRADKDAEERFLRENPVQFLPEGKTLVIRCRNHEKNRWFGGWANRNEATYTIHVPAQFSARLNTAGGGIEVSDLIGAVDANTSGGGLRFTDVHGPVMESLPAEASASRIAKAASRWRPAGAELTSRVGKVQWRAEHPAAA